MCDKGEDMKGTGDKVKTVKLITVSRTWLNPRG